MESSYSGQVCVHAIVFSFLLVCLLKALAVCNVSSSIYMYLVYSAAYIVQYYMCLEQNAFIVYCVHTDSLSVSASAAAAHIVGAKKFDFRVINRCGTALKIYMRKCTAASIRRQLETNAAIARRPTCWRALSGGASTYAHGGGIASEARTHACKLVSAHAVNVARRR